MPEKIKDEMVNTLQSYSKEMAAMFQRMTEELEHLKTTNSKRVVEVDSRNEEQPLLKQLSTLKMENKENKQALHAFIKFNEQERQRFSDELNHDIAQSVYSLLLKIKMLFQVTSTQQDNKSLQEIEHVMEDVLNKIRTISFELYPLMIEDIGFLPTLRSSIEKLRKEHGANIELSVQGDFNHLGKALEKGLYQICYTFLDTIIVKNALKSCNIELVTKEEKVQVELTLNDAFITDQLAEEMLLVRKCVEYWQGEFEVYTNNGQFVVQVVINIHNRVNEFV